MTRRTGLATPILVALTLVATAAPTPLGAFTVEGTGNAKFVLPG
jgi:hypothetical protein